MVLQGEFFSVEVGLEDEEDVPRFAGERTGVLFLHSERLTIMIQKV